MNVQHCTLNHSSQPHTRSLAMKTERESPSRPSLQQAQGVKEGNSVLRRHFCCGRGRRETNIFASQGLFCTSRRHACVKRSAGQSSGAEQSVGLAAGRNEPSGTVGGQPSDARHQHRTAQHNTTARPSVDCVPYREPEVATEAVSEARPHRHPRPASRGVRNAQRPGGDAQCGPWLGPWLLPMALHYCSHCGSTRAELTRVRGRAALLPAQPQQQPRAPCAERSPPPRSSTTVADARRLPSGAHHCVFPRSPLACPLFSSSSHSLIYLSVLVFRFLLTFAYSFPPAECSSHPSSSVLPGSLHPSLAAGCSFFCGVLSVRPCVVLSRCSLCVSGALCGGQCSCYGWRRCC